MASAPLTDLACMRLALRLARRGLGGVSPNPMVGAVLVKRGRVIGAGWHRRAGGPHAEIEALRDAARRGQNPRGATLYVTLEPCSTTGRTPPCTEAILAAGVRRVVAAATDPNPAHAGRGFDLLRQRGIAVETGLLEREAAQLNEVFNHWIVRRTPWITVKAALTLDGKIATAAGQSKWITGAPARAHAMRLRWAHDAVLVGVRTILADDPALTLRLPGARRRPKPWRRIILDPRARTPLTGRVATGAEAAQTILVAGAQAPAKRVAALARQVQVWRAPLTRQGLDLAWLLKELGRQEITSVLVEGGGETQAAFLGQGLAQRIAFYYAPLILGGQSSRKAVAGTGAAGWSAVSKLEETQWRRLGDDWLLTARVTGA